MCALDPVTGWRRRRPTDAHSSCSSGPRFRHPMAESLGTCSSACRRWCGRGIACESCSPTKAWSRNHSGGLPPSADVKTAVFSYPGVLRLAWWLLRRPALSLRLLRLVRAPVFRRPGFAARQLAATACWIRSSEELLGDERPSIAHAYDWPWSHGAAAVSSLIAPGARAWSRCSATFFRTSTSSSSSTR